MMSEADRVIRRLQSSDPDFDDCADAVAVINELRTELAALKVGQGEWVMVPAVASMDMKNAGWREIERQGIDPESCEMQSIYHAMLAAAQQKESDDE